MRKIEISVGTHVSMRERISALAWAANRRNSRVWVGPNVTNEIADYLAEHGYKTELRLMPALKKLVDEGYAYLYVANGGKRVKEFGFMPDVDLSGHSLPDQAIEAKADTGAKDYSGPVSLPPIPALPEPPIYRLDELTKHLKGWAEKNPETYAQWIDTAIQSLQENT